MQQWKKDNLIIKKYDTRAEMGQAAAKDAEETICRIIAEKGKINMIFAAAPSQNEMLAISSVPQALMWCSSVLMPRI